MTLKIFYDKTTWKVGNAEVIKPVFWEMQSGAEYTWYGSAVIKDGKYILSI